MWNSNIVAEWVPVGKRGFEDIETSRPQYCSVAGGRFGRLIIGGLGAQSLALIIIYR